MSFSSARVGATGRSKAAAALAAIARDARYACRSFLRAPLAAATIVATVGLGLGLVAVAFTLLNALVFRVDDVRNPSELFAVVRQPSAIERAEPFARSDYEALLRETDVFVDAFASTPDVTATIEGLRREGRLVTGNFFSVLGVTAEAGRTFGVADDEPGRPPVIVLSHRAWVQHYDADPAVVGRAFRVNGTEMRVVGVMPEDFRGLEPAWAPDFWAPLALVDDFTRSVVAEDSIDGLDIVGRIAPGVSSGEALARLSAWDSQRALARSDEPRRSLVLEPRTGTAPRPAEALLIFMPLFFAFGLILLIGCANVANVLLARLVARQREIGIRLSLGATRRRVVRQLLTENLLLALLSAAAAFVVSRWVLAGIVRLAIGSFPPEIGNLRIAVPPADWRVALFLVGGAAVSTMLFALLPALRATRIDLVRAARGEVLRGGRPGRARDALVALQVTGSVLLLICAATFLRSAWSAASVDPGVRVADVVSVAVSNEARRNAVLEAVRTEPAVATVAATWPSWLGGLGGAPAYADGANGRAVVRYQFASPELFDTLGIALVRGRGFSDGERSPNEAVAVVAESVAAELWPAGDALGQVLRLEPDAALVQPDGGGPAERDAAADALLRPRTAVVVGIARDVAGFSLGGVHLGSAGVYLPIGAETAATALTLRVRGDLESARRALVERLAAIDPNVAEVSTLQALARTDSYMLRASFWLTLALGVLALLLTLSGLFGVLSYLVEQRRREIGVRMALGASRGSIGALVLKQSARPVGLGILVGGGLAAGLTGALLATPAAAQVSAIVRLFDPVAYGASLVVIAAACAGAALLPALRAGRLDPLVALRQD